MQKLVLVLKMKSMAAVCLLGVLGIGVAFSAIEVAREISCEFDPSLGQANPFGGRAFITVTEIDGNTMFVFEQFPTPVVDVEGGARSITVETKRTLIFYDTDVETARAQVRMNLEYYYSLIGYEDRAGYSSYDEAMSCKQK